MCAIAFCAVSGAGAASAQADTDTASVSATVGPPSVSVPDGTVGAAGTGIVWNLTVRNTDATDDAGATTITLQLPADSAYGCADTTTVSVYDAAGELIPDGSDLPSYEVMRDSSDPLDTDASTPLSEIITVPDLPKGGEIVVNPTTWARTAAPASSYTFAADVASSAGALSATMTGPYTASVSGPTSVTAGGQVVYTVDVANAQGIADQEADWSTALPPGLVLDSLTPDSSAWTCDSAPASGGTVGCSTVAGEAAAEDDVFTLTATVPSDYAAGSISPLTVTAEGISAAAVTAASGSVTVVPQARRHRPRR